MSLPDTSHHPSVFDGWWDQTRCEYFVRWLCFRTYSSDPDDVAWKFAIPFSSSFLTQTRTGKAKIGLGRGQRVEGRRDHRGCMSIQGASAHCVFCWNLDVCSADLEELNDVTGRGSSSFVEVLVGPHTSFLSLGEQLVDKGVLKPGSLSRA